MVRKLHLRLPEPTADDSTSDLERIYNALGEDTGKVLISTRLANVKHLSEVIRKSGYSVTAVVGRMDGTSSILAIEPGDTSQRNYGLAFDIGTTTVVGQLVDLNARSILGTRIAFNRQAPYGSDVITRIICASAPGGLDLLNEAVIGNIDEIIGDLTSACEVNLGDIYAVCMAGNMTMMHLLLKIDPSNIRKAPYVPATSVFPTITAAEAGIGINPMGIASFMPGVTTYIGGDIVAGIVACGMAQTDNLTLLADIGTNGEIVLGNRDWMMGAAASAGPAFEGSGLKCGMKAVKGAIEKATISKGLDVEIWTIDGAKPKGICGSGYIDLLCQMLKSRIITKDGKMNREMKTPRIRKNGSVYEFVVVRSAEADTGRDIVIDEDDIENLKRAKGAIYSAIVSLLRKVGKGLSEVTKIYIAGGFGNYLNIDNAVFIGLLPDTGRDVYEFVGNSSLAGARMALVSHDAAGEAYAVHKNITYLDLSSEPDYMDEYIASLFFPHTDRERFPSVRL
jgi:uncharacterized 2Fe-2S/4Fe-4S cluster protein (DUF4445 family)